MVRKSKIYFSESINEELEEEQKKNKETSV